MFVVTWNSQGYKDIGPTLKQPGCNTAGTPYVFCIQESGTPAGWEKVTNTNDYTIYKVNFGSTTRTCEWYVTHREWQQSSSGNMRCSLAIYTKAIPEAVHLVAGEKRPLLGVKLPGCDFWIFTTHATSGPAGSVSANDLLDDLVKDGFEEKWCVAADYNCDPSEVQDPRWVVRGPKAVTHPVTQTKLDYLVQSLDLDDKLGEGVVFEWQGVERSDHTAQQFVCNLKKPK